jgi:hypothetical protein
MKKEILVIIPHSSRKRPKEIKKEWLSKNQRYLLYSETSETDRYSERLYNLKGFKKILFPLSQIYINICRSPMEIKKICPLKINGKKIYNKDISLENRKKLVKKYAFPFYKKIDNFKGKLILNGHTTISGHSSLKETLHHQIVISNIMKRKGKVIKFAPDEIIDIYVSELKKRLPNIKIGINSVYVDVYDYICDKFGWKKEGKGIPSIHQETDESLYIKDNKLNKKKLKKLSSVFAKSLEETYKRFYSCES